MPWAKFWKRVMTDDELRRETSVKPGNWQQFPAVEHALFSTKAVLEPMGDDLAPSTTIIFGVPRR